MDVFKLDCEALKLRCVFNDATLVLITAAMINLLNKIKYLNHPTVRLATFHIASHLTLYR